GGFLSFGADVSIGYQMQGTHDFSIANLLLSESYSMSLLGKVGVTAAIAGSFSVQLSAGSKQPDGTLWTRVAVHRKHSNTLTFAADVNVTASANTTGLPGCARDFLGSLLGLNAKNWLNLAQDVLDAGDPAVLKSELDHLAEHFVAEYVGKAV